MNTNDNPKAPTDSEIIDNKVVEKTNSLANTGEITRSVKVGKVDSLVIFEVSESELEVIERGSPNSTYLNFSIFLCSIFASFLISLLTCDFTNDNKLFYIFLIVCTIAGIIGALLFTIWCRSKNDVDDTIKKIRNRVT